MARRMFSTEIVDSDAFLEMGSSARLLYYDLGVRADMDGFVTPVKVFRLTGATSDDLRVLIARKFVYAFEDGVIVILHWLINNKIRGDVYVPSIYHDRLQPLIDAGLYSGKLPSGRPKKQLLTLDSTKEPLKESLKGPQLGKDSIGKFSKEKINKKEKSLETLQTLITDHPLFEPLLEFIEYRNQLKRPLTELGLKKIVALLDQYDNSTGAAMIDQSIQAGWTGVFPVKTNRIAERGGHVDLSHLG